MKTVIPAKGRADVIGAKALRLSPGAPEMSAGRERGRK
jgi:hypothetical protein